jgi:hypothetical protein
MRCVALARGFWDRLSRTAEAQRLHEFPRVRPAAIRKGIAGHAVLVCPCSPLCSCQWTMASGELGRAQDQAAGTRQSDCSRSDANRRSQWRLQMGPAGTRFARRTVDALAGCFRAPLPTDLESLVTVQDQIDPRLLNNENGASTRHVPVDERTRGVCFLLDRPRRKLGAGLAHRWLAVGDGYLRYLCHASLGGRLGGTGDRRTASACRHRHRQIANRQKPRFRFSGANEAWPLFGRCTTRSFASEAVTPLSAGAASRNSKAPQSETTRPSSKSHAPNMMNAAATTCEL